MNWKELLDQLRESQALDTPLATELMGEYDASDSVSRNTLLLCAHYVCEGEGSDAAVLEAWLAQITERCWLEPNVELRRRLVWARLYSLMRTKDLRGLNALVDRLGATEADSGVWQKVLKIMREWPTTAQLYFNLFDWPALQPLRGQLPEFGELEDHVVERLRRMLHQGGALIHGMVDLWDDVTAGEVPLERLGWTFDEAGRSGACFPLSAAFVASKLVSSRPLDAELALTLWGRYLDRQRGADSQLHTPDYWRAIVDAGLGTDLRTCCGLWTLLAKSHLTLETGDPAPVWLLWQSAFADLAAVMGPVDETLAQELNKNAGEFLAALTTSPNLSVDWNVWTSLAARAEFFLAALAVDVIRYLQLAGHDASASRQVLQDRFQGPTTSGFGGAKDVTLPDQPATVWVPAPGTWGLWKNATPNDDKFMNLGGLFGLLKTVQVPETNYRAQLVLKDLNKGGNHADRVQ